MYELEDACACGIQETSFGRRAIIKTHILYIKLYAVSVSMTLLCITVTAVPGRVSRHRTVR
jgi:hypothetical protein